MKEVVLDALLDDGGKTRRAIIPEKLPDHEMASDRGAAVLGLLCGLRSAALSCPFF